MGVSSCHRVGRGREKFNFALRRVGDGRFQMVQARERRWRSNAVRGRRWAEQTHSGGHNVTKLDGLLGKAGKGRVR